MQSAGSILVVDDEELVREYASEMLGDHGFTTLTAPDGMQGLKAYMDNPGGIDVVLLDLKMPGMPGRTVLQRLRILDPDVKVIISSSESEDRMMELMREGARGFVAKPFETSELLQMVGQLIAE